MAILVAFSLYLMTPYATPKTTRISIGSCIFPNRDKSILHKIANRNPDLFIMTGDATYLDYESIDLDSNLGILKGHFIGVPSPTEGKTQSEVKQLWKQVWDMVIKDKHWLTLKQKTKILSIWDDHDYGQNDGTYKNKYRELAKELYLNAMDIDTNDIRRQRNGLYYYYPLKVKLTDNITKIIDIILLDIRYFAKQDGELNILGNEQWIWLEDILMNKLHGDLTLIASGIQITPISRIKTAETWARYPESQKRLFKLINEIKVKKKQEIILISGDVHRGEIMKVVCQYGNYFNEFTEVTSSGLTHSIGDDAPFVIRNLVKISHILDTDGITECLWRGMNVGEIDIEWNDNGNGIRNVNVSILDDKMNVKCVSEIQPMINSNKEWYKELNENKYAYLLKISDDLECFGAVEQFTENDKYWKQTEFNLLYMLIAITPLFILAVLYQCVQCLCLKKKKQKTN
eukprot:16572_1